MCTGESDSWFHFGSFAQCYICNFIKQILNQLLCIRPVYLLQSESDLLILSHVVVISEYSVRSDSVLLGLHTEDDMFLQNEL